MAVTPHLAQEVHLLEHGFPAIADGGCKAGAMASQKAYGSSVSSNVTRENNTIRA
jgi:hypothetical protein